ncbi:hypothetical protein LPJ53_004926 [Coemansia erecta]|uniref:DUF4246 domain-containing protein n=1 Tax=Coemansia erecta TaxID=147472 RepID=A0A9W7XTE7_9FUNG|nr:hypothetical protein LPJ53_004926 [Coemansia erecta]
MFTVPIPAYDYDKLSKIYGDSWQDMVHAWKKGLVYNDPVPGKFAEPDIPSPGHYTLNGEHMQVFVKMANVYLTPDRPEYTPDQSAFVPGTNSERIVATAMYLYDADNIEDIEVRFSESVDKHYYKSDIHNYIDHLVYGVSYPGVISDYSNDCGVIEINRGSLFCYPNTYERRIGTCRLDDKLRKGHFKMMILYFVNPAQRIISTSIVPPQQPRWSLSRLVVASSPLSRLPEDIQIMITEQLDRSTTYEEADRIRNRLTLKYHEYNKEYSSWRPGYSTSLNAYSRTFKPCL